MIPGKLYVSVLKVSFNIWNMAGNSPSVKLLATVEPKEPFVFVGFEKEISMATDNRYFELKVLNLNGIIGFTSFLPLSYFEEVTE